jgi:uracil-DNA glycosylase family 4
MNSKMYANPWCRRISAGSGPWARRPEPGYGELACRTEGQGRLAEVGDIAEEIETMLAPKDFQGERVLVTAGPTQEAFDPVRFITNHSSGKMGYALATMARRRGAEVTLVSGPTSLASPKGVRSIAVTTAREMRDAVMGHLDEATVVIKAAAVADYRPETFQKTKIKKKEGPIGIRLERNPDIISEIAGKKGNRILVGFSMESDHLIEHARAKLMEKGMDFIVANDVTETGAGFGGDTNVVRILDREGGVENLPIMDKLDVAEAILDRVRQIGRAKEKSMAAEGTRGGTSGAGTVAQRADPYGQGAEEAPRLSARAAVGTGTAGGNRTEGGISSDNGGAEGLESVRGELGDCQRCGLGRRRHSLVFGEGNPRAELVFVGEAPGADEDAQGRPFVGQAGQLLTKIIAAMGFKREEVYICNILKCRPPGNRNPQPDEIDACEPFLIRQLQAIGPRIICALGTFAAHTLLKSEAPISALRGRFHTYQGIPLMPTYHPAYLLRNPGAKKQVWEDVQLVMKALEKGK